MRRHQHDCITDAPTDVHMPAVLGNLEEASLEASVVGADEVMRQCADRHGELTLVKFGPALRAGSEGGRFRRLGLGPRWSSIHRSAQQREPVECVGRRY